MEILYTVIVVVAFTAILTFVSMRHRAASWAGVATDIRRHTYMKNEIEEEEIIVSYRTDAGKKGKIKLNPHAYNQLYSDLKVGDRLVKKSGEYMPSIEKASGTAAPGE